LNTIIGIGDCFDAVKNKSLPELRRAIAHGTFNGAMRWAQGGKFEHGFLSGFVSSLGGSYLQANGANMTGAAKIAISAAIGGTAEALGGGKFANGAVTGAYVMAWNHMIHPPQTGATPKELNAEQRKLLKAKIEEAAWKERVARNKEIETGSDKLNIKVSFDIGIEKSSSSWDHNLYSAENLDVTIGNKTITIDVLYSVQNDMNVVRIDVPGVDVTSGRHRFQSYSHKHGFIIEIKYKSETDYNIFEGFINARKIY